MAIYLIVNSHFFCYYMCGGDNMNITQLIKSNRQLNELPFLVVFRTIQVLKESGLLVTFETKKDVDTIQP